ncbi:hypothetical protein ACF09H_32105 [Streptomyces sp. NPDC014983]|uniref:hypothetical protein n=1 Tax=Streptomyces sp. NPDC014983 TaxID=3364933 RepID=UPI0037006362
MSDLSNEWRDSLDEWDLLCLASTAVELYDNYGDVNDVLSLSQIETLERVRPLVRITDEDEDDEGEDV